MKNTVSVIVNYHNGEKYLENCIKSILNQNYKDFEVILWDNASTDNSKLRKNLKIKESNILDTPLKKIYTRQEIELLKFLRANL